MSKRALGKGISALIKDLNDGKVDKSTDVKQIRINSLKPNPYQMRESFSSDSLKELADSIKTKGIIQPLLVEGNEDGTYTVIAGERRFRAAQMIGLSQVPVLIRHFTDAEKLEVALIENVQRENLTPIEEAHGYKNLMEIAKLSQDEVAQRVGKNRATVANCIRLLKLPENIIEALKTGEITAGHGRAILSVEAPGNQQRLFSLIKEKALSVRASEAEAVRLNKLGIQEKSGKLKKERMLPLELMEIEQKLIDLLGTKVKIIGDLKNGKIEVSYYSSDDLERVIEIFGL